MIKPVRDFLVVTKEAGEKKIGNIILTGPVDDKISVGEVLAVGSGKVTANGTIVPLEVSVGDKIAFNRNFVTELKDGDTTVLVLREEQVLAVMK